MLDLATGRVVGRIDGGPGTTGAVPSGTGEVVLIADPARSTLTVVPRDGAGAPAVLPGTAAMTEVYTAWLDSVAFVADVARGRLLVYDLDRRRANGEVALAGVPGRGAVTSDSAKLYLPLTDQPRLLAVDGQTGRVTAAIDLPGRPAAAIVAGGWGICH